MTTIRILSEHPLSRGRSTIVVIHPVTAWNPLVEAGLEVRYVAKYAYIRQYHASRDLDLFQANSVYRRLKSRLQMR
jgi:hypothetical protein